MFGLIDEIQDLRRELVQSKKDECKFLKKVMDAPEDIALVLLEKRIKKLQKIVKEK